MSGTIYILQDGEHINTDIYKIGKTLCINTRLTQYSKNTVLHYTFPVEKDLLDKVEKKVIDHFNRKFNIAKGREWFRGSLENMIQEMKHVLNSFSEDIKEERDAKNICQFCSKEFSCKLSLIRHQKTTKSCIILQGKEDTDIDIECPNCDKKLAPQYFKQHKAKCDLVKGEIKKTENLYNEMKEKYKILEKKNKTLEKKYYEEKESGEKMKIEIVRLQSVNDLLKELIDNKYKNKNFMAGS